MCYEPVTVNSSWQPPPPPWGSLELEYKHSLIRNNKGNKYVLGSMRDKSLYFFELDNKKITNIKRVSVGERVRDLTFEDNKLYLFLENSASLGIIEIN